MYIAKLLPTTTTTHVSILYVCKPRKREASEAVEEVEETREARRANEPTRINRKGLDLGYLPGRKKEYHCSAGNHVDQSISRRQLVYLDDIGNDSDDCV